MATYYVRNDGSDSNNGLGPATNQAWATFTKIMSSIASGDTVYIAPGTYRTSPVTATFANPTSRTYIYGNPTATQFPGLTPGIVRVTSFIVNDNTDTNVSSFIDIAKDFITLSNIYFESKPVDGNRNIVSINSKNLEIDKCAFITYGGYGVNLIPTGGGIPSDAVIKNSIFIGYSSNGLINFTYSSGHSVGSAWNHNITISNCFFTTSSGYLTRIYSNINGGGGGGGGFKITNCTFVSGTVKMDRAHINAPSYITNCVFANATIDGCGNETDRNYLFENYNRLVSSSRINCIAGANSASGALQLDIGLSHLFGLSAKQNFFTPIPGSVNIGFGDPTYSLATDILSNSWINGASDPDAGAFTSIQLSGTGYYLPTERDITNLTIAPNTTSRSETIYLGVTGLTHLTSGLSASYVRTGSARVGFSLASQTVTGAWSSGGFVEIDAVNMPGMYRIDIPNAAFSSGASSVTVAIKNSNTAFGTYLSYSLQPVYIDLTQAVPYSNTAQTIGDSLNAARSSGFGKWVLNDKTLTLYGADNTTVVKTLTLNSTTYPTERS